MTYILRSYSLAPRYNSVNEPKILQTCQTLSAKLEDAINKEVEMSKLINKIRDKFNVMRGRAEQKEKDANDGW